MVKTKECIGKCVNCGSENLDYIKNDFDSDTLYVKYCCDDCSYNGVELYLIKYLRSE